MITTHTFAKSLVPTIQKNLRNGFGEKFKNVDFVPKNAPKITQIRTFLKKMADTFWCLLNSNFVLKKLGKSRDEILKKTVLQAAGRTEPGAQ